MLLHLLRDNYIAQTALGAREIAETIETVNATKTVQEIPTATAEAAVPLMTKKVMQAKKMTTLEWMHA
jgi:hypothetical protein